MKHEEMAFLLDLKALMEHAILHQQSGTKIDIHLAINHTHQAIELTLRKKAELLGENPYYFPEIIKTLKNRHVKIPYERQIEELNEARRLTQHYGTTPNENDARRLIFVARDFLIDFWKEAFGVDYDDVSLHNLITNTKVKELVMEAAKSTRAGEYDKVVINSVQAIYEVQWGIQKKFRERPPKPTGFEVDLGDTVDFILNVALSSPFAYKLLKLKETTGIVYLPIPEGEPVMQRLKEHKFTREDAAFALELATEYALWAEQVYG